MHFDWNGMIWLADFSMYQRVIEKVIVILVYIRIVENQISFYYLKKNRRCVKCLIYEEDTLSFK